MNAGINTTVDSSRSLSHERIKLPYCVVDWILARCRSGVNVMADMLVAVLIDRWARARGS
jgi:hypothetical protein